jgi:hypothetical protein
MNKSAIICKGLTPQRGKILRYISSRGPAAPVGIKDVINKIAWSDLPHSFLESKTCFDILIERKLIEEYNKKYVATSLGNKVIHHANKNRLWQQPPPVHIINSFRRS